MTQKADTLQTEVAQLRKRVAQLEQQNTLLQGLISSAPLPLWARDPDGTFLVANKQGTAPFGLTPEEMTGKIDAEVLPPDALPLSREQDRIVRETGTPICTEDQLPVGDKIHTFSTMKFPIYDEQGELIAFGGAAFDITKQRQTETAVQQLNTALEQQMRERTRDLDVFKLLVENSPDGIGMADSQGVLVYANPAYQQMTGYGEELIGMPITDLIPTETTLANEVVPAIVEGQRAWSGEAIYQRKDGSYFPAHVSAFGAYDDAGNLIGLPAIVRDISERKQLEERLQFILEGSGDGAWDIFLERDEAYLSPRYHQMLGYELGEIGLNMAGWQNLIHPDDLNHVNQVFRAYLMGERSDYEIEHRLRTKAGEWRWMQGRGKIVARDEAGKPLRMTGTLTDIHERKQTEEDLHIFKSLVENTPDGIVYATPEQRVVYCNSVYRTITGFGDQAIGSCISDYYFPEDLPFIAETLMPTVVREGSWQGVLRLRRPDGTHWMGQSNVFGLYNEAGEMILLAATFRDVTEQLEAEKERELLQERLQFIMAGSGDGAWDIFLERDEIYLSPRYYEMLGYEPGDIELTLTAGKNTLHPDDLEHVNQTLGAYLAGEIPKYEIEHRCRTKAGEWRWMMVRGKIVTRDASGTPLRLTGTITDIHERKQTEEDLHIFKSLVENTPDGIVYATPEQRVVYCNPAFATITGVGDQTIGSRISDYYSPEDFAVFSETVIPTVVCEGNWQGVLRLRRFDGTHWMCQSNVFGLYNEAGEMILLASTLRDVTKQIEAEQERELLQQQVIDAQRAALRELSTPLIPLTDEILIMPLIGSIDSQRAVQVMETLLDGVATHHARIVILDITGVQVVDTGVANAFIQAAQAVQLLGAQVMITGIQPQIAQTLVHLGVNLGAIATQGSLQAGIAAALQGKHSTTLNGRHGQREKRVLQ